MRQVTYLVMGLISMTLFFFTFWGLKIAIDKYYIFIGAGVIIAFILVTAYFIGKSVFSHIFHNKMIIDETESEAN